MLQTVDVGTQSLEAYADLVGRDKMAELRELARPLRGARVAQINATSCGGGVSERLRSMIPLLRSLGIDDPEGWDSYRKIVEASEGDPDVHVFTNLNGVGNAEVHAFQRHSSVVLQKSIREGFGLVVSETLWKKTPVVAGKTGGLPLQMPVGVGGYLVSGAAEAAEKTLYLIQHREAAEAVAIRGREHVRQHFLLTRLLADVLKLLASL